MPDLCIRLTVPSTSVPVEYSCARRSHGFSIDCLMPNEIRCLSLSMPSTITSTFWPLWRTSLGCLIRFVQDMSEMWTRPSMPSSSWTNAPKSVRFRTRPSILDPTGYLLSRSCHGSLSVLLRDSEIFSSALLTLRTFTSTMSPIPRILEGWRMCCVHDISEMWMRPSTPSLSSTNAP